MVLMLTTGVSGSTTIPPATPDPLPFPTMEGVAEADEMALAGATVVGASVTMPPAAPPCWRAARAVDEDDEEETELTGMLIPCCWAGMVKRPDVPPRPSGTLAGGVVELDVAEERELTLPWETEMDAWPGAPAPARTGVTELEVLELGEPAGPPAPTFTEAETGKAPTPTSIEADTGPTPIACPLNGSLPAAAALEAEAEAEAEAEEADAALAELSALRALKTAAAVITSLPPIPAALKKLALLALLTLATEATLALLALASDALRTLALLALL